VRLAAKRLNNCPTIAMAVLGKVIGIDYWLQNTEGVLSKSWKHPLSSLEGKIRLLLKVIHHFLTALSRNKFFGYIFHGFGYILLFYCLYLCIIKKHKKIQK
jgi:hypothetical protein